MADRQSEPVRVYLRFLRVFGTKRTKSKSARSQADSEPFGSGRDPRGVGEVLTSLSTELGWSKSLAQAELLDSWAEIAGPELASHSSPFEIHGSVLTVSCDSTAWATELGLLRNQVLAKINELLPDAEINRLRFIGPVVPSWKKGFRSIPGRGPRDTYG